MGELPAAKSCMTTGRFNSSRRLLLTCLTAATFAFPWHRTCTRTGRLLSLLPLSPLSTHLFSFGPQSAHAVGEVIHVYPIDSSSSVVPTGRRGLGIFPLARVALARPLTCPGVSQWNIGLILRKGPKAKPGGSVRSTLRFLPLLVQHPGGRRPRAWA